MSETLGTWERALTKRLADAGAPTGSADDPLDLLEAIDATEAARFALRLMRVDEMQSLRATDMALGDRKRAAYGTLLRGLAGLSLDEMTSALVSGALWVNWNVPWQHERFTFLSEHPALATPEARLHVVRALVGAHGWSGVPVPWFLHRLIEDPVPEAGDELYAAWREHRGDSRIEPLLAEAVLATGHREGIAAIAATLGTETPSREAVSANLCLDSATATERLGHLLDPARFDPGPRPLGSTQLLEALKADGLRGGEIPGFPSRRPRGWVRADPRWVSLLLPLRANRDPNVSFPVRGALAHADPEVVASCLPKPSKKKSGKGLALRGIGRAAFVGGTYWGVPIAMAGERLALFPRASSLEVRHVTDDLPLLFAIELPTGLALPSEARAVHDDGWSREGIHGIALHPKAARVALSASSHDTSGVSLFDEKGRVTARWQTEDAIPHRLHWGAGGTTLWVLAEADGTVVVALDPETLEERGRCAIGNFPPPAFPSAFAHPTDDVGCFQILCGQDGFWVKCVERAAKGYKIRSQKLSAVHHEWLMYGLAEDGAAVLTSNDTKLLVRDWPTMKPRKGKVLAGQPRGTAGSAKWVIVPVATVGNAADRLELFRLPDGDKVGSGPWPEGHVLFDLCDEVVLTTKDGEVHAWRLEGLGAR